MFGPDPIGADTVASLVAQAWGIELDTIDYSAIGYGSHHWIGAGAGGRWLVTADSSDQRPVVAAYELAYRLGKKLEFVRPPRVQLNGRIVLEAGRWLISVWPWVVGQSGEFAEQRSPEHLAVVASCLRELHDCAEFAQVDALIDERSIPGRAVLMQATQQPRSRADGPYATEVAERVRVNESRIREMFARYDDLAASVWDATELVVTHGEPHVGNFVHTASSAVLIDWDTVRWAPRERDLWWLPADGWQDSYGEDVVISESAVAMYRLRWTLCDITDFAPPLLTAEEPTPDLAAAMQEIQRLLPL